jgi:16S rRNA (cytosine1402-N4)-methyltransferase
MRFDPTQGLTAADLVNNLTVEELADILYRFGEEKQSWRIARAMAASRPFETTGQLAEVITSAVGGRRGRIHPATKSFQALRIAVNEELAALEDALPQAINVLRTGGRLAVISFHSLEDRIVKRFFRRQAKDCICPPEQPVCTCDHRPTVRIITRRPVQPDEAEIAANPRARSGRLRVAEKL